MIKENEVSTNNVGTLTTEEGFVYQRGIPRKLMGTAHDESGNRYKIYTASCGAPHCICWSTAKKI